MTGQLFAGIDVGASATKAVLIDGDGKVVGSAVLESGMDFVGASQRALDAALEQAGAQPDDVAAIVATGYGRRNVASAKDTKTEITCHARGAHFHFPGAITVIDIGGQDNKIIKLGSDGSRADFKMNRKCAAGTGAFLEEMARRLAVPIEQMEGLARQSKEDVEIGSFCTVFSATEVLALARKGTAVEDIAKAAFRSVVKRIVEMDPLDGKVVATGGVVAHNPTVVELLSEAIGGPVYTTPEPQLTGALGAALFARDGAAS